MVYYRHKHRRRSIRLPGCDYSHPGAYFVTLCTYGRDCLFGNVNGGAVRLNDYGLVARDEWLRSAAARAEIELDAFVVMPNHIHGIVVIADDVVGATGRSPLHYTDDRPRGPTKRSLASFICGYKPAVTRRINQMRDTPGARVWQRNYYERVIRDDDELARARGYVADNPGRWAYDDYFVD
jgi:putative transposase